MGLVRTNNTVKRYRRGCFVMVGPSVRRLRVRLPGSGGDCPSLRPYRGEPDELRARIRRDALSQAGRFLTRLRQDMPDAQYLLCTQHVGTTQDGFAKNYGSAWNEVQHRKIVFALNREFDAWVKEKNDPKLLLLPLGHAVDPVDGFIFQKQKASARSEREVRRAVNAVHPSAIGGYQMGDAIAAMLMNHLGR